MKRNLKKWKATCKELRKWKLTQGVFFYSSYYAQVILLDLGEPIACFIQKPFRITKYTNGNIIGVFSLNEHLEKTAKQYYIAANYIPGLKSFVYELQAKELNIIMSNTFIRYLELPERKLIKEKFSTLARKVS